MSTATVVLVDLRGGGEPPDDLAGGVVVVDRADALVDHAETYLTLLGADMVTAVVCVAVGEAAQGLDGVVLELPPALWQATVLWVGDPLGVDWAPDRGGPRPLEQPGNALAHLVSALLVPTLFDQVITTAETLPSAVVNPGIRLVSSSSDAVELAEARAAAVESLCTTRSGPGADLGALVRRTYLPGSRDGAVLGGSLLEVRAQALRRLDNADELARRLGSVTALVGAERPGKQLGHQLTWAGQAVENHRRVIAELLNRVDGCVQVGRPSVPDVVELGVPHPREVDGAEIAADLRQAVDTRLDAGDALSGVADALRTLAANESPQGCTAALDEVHRRGPITLPVPEFRAWPLSLFTLPAIFLSCALVVLLVGGWAGAGLGALLGLLWFGGGWLLLGRRPAAEHETGLEAALPKALLSYGAAALAGVGVAVLAGRLFAVRLARLLLDIPVWLPTVVIAVLALAALATVVLSWHAAVRAWREELRINALRATVADLTRIAEDVTAREWLPLLRRRALAAAATQVAGGLDEIAGTLATAGNHLFVAADPGSNGQVKLVRPVPQELYAVIRGDLLDVCRDALSPAWHAAGKAMHAKEGVYAQRLARLLAEYGAEVHRDGLLTPNRFSNDPAPRDALMARVWTESPAALAALRTTAGGDMTQLCRGGQLGYLSKAADPGLIRFAPRRLREVLDREGVHKGLTTDPGVVWSEGGELVGVLRLLPLRPESVRHVVDGVR